MNVSRWVVIALALAIVSPVLAQPAPGRGRAAKTAPPKPEVTKDQLAAWIAALSGPDLEAAARAAVRLGETGSPVAHAALLDALGKGPPSPVSGPILLALAAAPAPGDVALLLRYANHRQWPVRGSALRALASYADPLARQRIVAGLRDPNGDVRRDAATAAVAGRVRDAIEPLFALLARGEVAAARALAGLADADLAYKLADQHGKAPDAVVVLALLEILKRDDVPDSLRSTLVGALGKIGGTLATDALHEYVRLAEAKQPRRASVQDAQRQLASGGGK